MANFFQKIAAYGGAGGIPGAFMTNDKFRNAITGSSTGGNAGKSSTGKYAGDKLPHGYEAGQLQQFTPEQMSLFESLFPYLSEDSDLARMAGGDQSMFEEMEAPAMRQFAGLQGNIASRFSGMGMGGRRSSGFQNTMGQAGSDFASDLQSKRQGLQRQALQDLMGLSSNLMNQKPYERFLSEKPKSFWEKLAGGTLRAGGTAAGAYFGGPQGAQAGYQGGNALAESFGY